MQQPPIYVTTKSYFCAYYVWHIFICQLLWGNRKSCVRDWLNFFFLKLKDQYNKIFLRNVLYSPQLTQNLLSSSKLENEGAHIVGTKSKLLVYNTDWRDLIFSVRRDSTYFIKTSYYVIQLESTKIVNSLSMSILVPTYKLELSVLR